MASSDLMRLMGRLLAHAIPAARHSRTRVSMRAYLAPQGPAAAAPAGSAAMRPLIAPSPRRRQRSRTANQQLKVDHLDKISEGAASARPPQYRLSGVLIYSTSVHRCSKNPGKSTNGVHPCPPLFSPVYWTPVGHGIIAAPGDKGRITLLDMSNIWRGHGEIDT